jgi:hypothetical protein
MILLDDGRVLLVGGFSGGQIQSSALLYDPFTNLWIPALNGLPSGRTRFGIARLVDGRILVTGGNFLSSDPFTSQATKSCSVFDPMTGAFEPAPDLPEARLDHSCFVDGLGNAVVAAGYASSGISTSALPTNTSRFLVPGGTGWSTGPTLGLAGPRTTATLQSGDAITVGGFGSIFTQGNSIRHDSTFASVLPAIPESRAFGGAIRLLDGSVLVAGGFRFESAVPSQFLSTAWVFTPDN